MPIKNIFYYIFHLVSARLIKQRVKQSSMPIRTSKSKIYWKIHVVNIHRIYTMQKIICHIVANQRFHTSLAHDMPGGNAVLLTCSGRDRVLRYALVGTQFYDMPRLGCSYLTSLCPEPYQLTGNSGSQINMEIFV